MFVLRFGVVYVVWFASGGLVCFWWIVDLRVMCLGRVGSVRFSVCGCDGCPWWIAVMFSFVCVVFDCCRLVVWGVAFW